MQQPFEPEFLIDSIPRKRRRCNESEQPQFWRAYMRPRLSTLSSLSNALIDREARLEQKNNVSIISSRLHQKELEDLRSEMDELRTAMDELCIAMHAFRYSALRQGSPLPLGLRSDQIEAYYQSTLDRFSPGHPLRPTVEALCVPMVSTSTHKPPPESYPPLVDIVLPDYEDEETPAGTELEAVPSTEPGPMVATVTQDVPLASVSLDHEADSLPDYEDENEAVPIDDVPLVAQTSSAAQKSIDSNQSLDSSFNKPVEENDTQPTDANSSIDEAIDFLNSIAASLSPPETSSDGSRGVGASPMLRTTTNLNDDGESNEEKADEGEEDDAGSEDSNEEEESTPPLGYAWGRYLPTPDATPPPFVPNPSTEYSGNTFGEEPRGSDSRAFDVESDDEDDGEVEQTRDEDEDDDPPASSSTPAMFNTIEKLKNTKLKDALMDKRARSTDFI